MCVHLCMCISHTLYWYWGHSAEIGAVCMCVQFCAYASSCISRFIHTVCTDTYTHTYACTYTHKYTNKYARANTLTHARTQTDTHIHSGSSKWAMATTKLTKLVTRCSFRTRDLTYPVKSSILHVIKSTICLRTKKSRTRLWFGTNVYRMKFSRTSCFQRRWALSCEHLCKVRTLRVYVYTCIFIYAYVWA